MEKLFPAVKERVEMGGRDVGKAIQAVLDDRSSLLDAVGVAEPAEEQPPPYFVGVSTAPVSEPSSPLHSEKPPDITAENVRKPGFLGRAISHIVQQHRSVPTEGGE